MTPLQQFFMGQIIAGRVFSDNLHILNIYMLVVIICSFDHNCLAIFQFYSSLREQW